MPAFVCSARSRRCATRSLTVSWSGAEAGGSPGSVASEEIAAIHAAFFTQPRPERAQLVGSRRADDRARCCLGAAVGLTLVAAATLPAAATAPTVHPLVGAYYYLWNPENFAGGTARGPSGPAAAARRFARQLTEPADGRQGHHERPPGRDQLLRHGLVALRPGLLTEDSRNRQNAMKAFLKAPNISQMRFAMFYETWNLGFDPGSESTPVTFANGAALRCGHGLLREGVLPQPVLSARRRPARGLLVPDTDPDRRRGGPDPRGTDSPGALGFNPFFIGDEVYWRVTPENPNPAGPVLTTTPQVGRIDQFDAITSYIYYYGDPDWLLGPTADFTGYPGTTDIVADERHLLAEYSAATDGRVPVIPDVASGFNDRGFRLQTNHSAQPRQWQAGEGPASTLDHLFRCVAIPEVSPTLPMVMVTSWNDWNEDTGVEPISGTPTDRDDSPSGQAYTQGYTYGGEGREALRALRADVDLLDGRFADGHAKPAAPRGTIRETPVEMCGRMDGASSPGRP